MRKIITLFAICLMLHRQPHITTTKQPESGYSAEGYQIEYPHEKYCK